MFSFYYRDRLLESLQLNNLGDDISETENIIDLISGEASLLGRHVFVNYCRLSNRVNSFVEVSSEYKEIFFPLLLSPFLLRMTFVADVCILI